jgi:hypothetical protein
MRMPTVRGPNEQSQDLLEDPEVRLSLTSRSGPIVVAGATIDRLRP